MAALPGELSPGGPLHSRQRTGATEKTVDRTGWAAVGVVVVAAAVGGYFWWQNRPAPVEAPAAAAPQSAPAPAPAASAEPAIRYPVEAASEAAPANSEAWVRETIAALLGETALRRFVTVDDFPRRLAATVDALPSGLSASRLWPVQPTPDRFLVEQRGAATAISPDNAARYRPFVALAESVDPARLAAAYRRLYPLLQQAYESLGYSGKYFNDRVIAVIDHLLATPVPPETVEVRLPEFKGPVQPTRPWVYYEYADPDLEARSAGQKWLMRMGRDNERRIKAKLIELRALLVQGAVVRKP